MSSARAHLTGHDDKLVQVQPMLDRIDNWRIYLSDAGKRHHQELIKRHTRTGRTLGGKEFVRKLETLPKSYVIRTLLVPILLCAVLQGVRAAVQVKPRVWSLCIRTAKSFRKKLARACLSDRSETF